MYSSLHFPVLVDEVLELLNVQPNHWYLDATFGGGGHAREILAAGGNVIGVDQDREAIRMGKSSFKELGPDRLKLIQGRMSNLTNVLDKLSIQKVSGVLLDLGISSDQLAGTNRGFSFQREEPLDMRMDQTLTVTAADLVNGLTKRELAELFTRYGEVRFANEIAEKITRVTQKHRIMTTTELAKIPEQVHSRHRVKRKRIHPATQVFQALRIAVNDELNELEAGLPQAVEHLDKRGRLLVISFHSLEDRIVKNFMASRRDLEVLTKKPIVPTEREILENPRSRSAKLRVGERIKITNSSFDKLRMVS